MEEDRKKRKNSASSSSKIQKNKDLTNDELLEQILNKKKNKKTSSNVSTSKKSSNIQTAKKTSKTSSKKSLKETSDDELLEAILNKKKAKKNKSGTTKPTSKKETKDSKAEKSTVVSSEKINDSNRDVKNVEKEDLIITREINFDEKLDLNNKKVLEQLRKAIEDFDNLEDLEEIHSSYDSKDDVTEEQEIIIKNKNKYDDSYLTDVILPSDKKKNRVKYDNNEKQKIILLLVIIILIITLILILKVTIKEALSIKALPEIKNVVVDEPEIDYELLELQYQNCMTRQFDDRDITEEYIEAQNQLTTYLSSNYKTSVAYEDLNYGFKYNYNLGTVYYAASTIKVLDGLYIYTKASLGELSLDDTMVYTSKYKWSSSKEMSKYKYGSKVTLRELVKYAITVSDNSAHQMLVDYIGRQKLKEFGLSLGATNTLNGSDNFGNISTEDAIIYLKAINEFIINNPGLGDELKSYLIAAEQNDLAIPEYGIIAGHKYGQYSSYYHDIGIVYDTNPYLIAILTTEGAKDFESIVKDINKHVYELHKLFLENRENICKNEVYGN